ncbi:hypothetical protein BVE84_08285 [Streptococcus azizii]|uniref:Uncharacterized protein n=1 Tax=Streptococcus azizii TaxID=1579424 RepID=A0AB36JJM7_9STRE|nr:MULTISPECIES: hypothetical protein [Streptococcus]MBF0776977.1 hypothetical protein [Streptococcus sp. 19428wD3_AN2]ONK25446.1 hypothetical protein BVE86_10245 [Streptococcus azizii]ONK25531.1 hypothetical protein BVE85_09920 [Streptococcus azizii]ONK27195.1 hypothetical protein BVE84_08285 [Streptococcus azizii]TFU81971.1 hypothetical protein E4T83_09505 [Streptococcus sp. AN2]
MFRKLNQLELKWFKLLLDSFFEGKEIIATQLEDAVVVAEILEPIISLKLKTTSKLIFPYEERIPAQMLVFQPDGDSIDFLLHVVDGFIDELEVYSTSGKSISPNSILLEDIRYNTFSKPGSYFYDD